VRTAARPPAGGLPSVEQVRPGLWSVPVPIPDLPLAYVLSYAFELRGGGLVLVDPGWNAEESLGALEAGLAAFDAALTDVRGVLVTHIHPDHYGLAGRVRDTSGAWIALHPADAALIPERYEGAERLLRRTAGWLADAGAPAGELERLGGASLQIRRFVVTARPDVLLDDGDRPDVPGWDLVALHTPGHSPGHLCFWDERSGVLLTGDHVLPRITPNIGLHPQSTADPLGDYLDSLERLRSFDGALALPGHEWRVDDLAARIDELRDHHERRLDEILGVLAQGATTVWEVAARLHWSRGWEGLHGFMRRAAIAETYAHLVLLERRARITRAGAAPIRWRGA
jgi:glyoxylase-like metal-dependent hydrolase (beta-lactamase superfamily II)